MARRKSDRFTTCASFAVAFTRVRERRRSGVFRNDVSLLVAAMIYTFRIEGTFDCKFGRSTKGKNPG